MDKIMKFLATVPILFLSFCMFAVMLCTAFASDVNDFLLECSVDEKFGIKSVPTLVEHGPEVIAADDYLFTCIRISYTDEEDTIGTGTISFSIEDEVIDRWKAAINEKVDSIFNKDEEVEY